jgi:hypothetical protein
VPLVTGGGGAPPVGWGARGQGRGVRVGKVAMH